MIYLVLKLEKICRELFNTDFKKVVNIYFKGGDFEKAFFRDFVYSNVNIIDLGSFRHCKIYE